MTIKITHMCIPDVALIEPQVFSDERGYFFESFNEKNFFLALKKKVNFVQDNFSYSRKGVLRGLHYQLQQAQGKLIRVNSGAVFDVVVDLRESSEYFGKSVCVELSAENKKQLWVPPGFAHGFLALSDGVEVVYKASSYWNPSSEYCINWNDPFLNIKWPHIGSSIIVSAKDSKGLCWNEAPKYHSTFKFT
jgi:dTDP-4-dehydrorhamnose 3,5-epimerase